MVAMVIDNGGPLSCCGQEMDVLTPNTVDASNEKHVPVATRTEDGITVSIGSVAHPMEDKHYISFVYVITKDGGHRKILGAGAEPKVDFLLKKEEEVTMVFAYCNLHGLWMCEL
jgi:superoxide reductase